MPPNEPPPEGTFRERLDSWKEIAAYLHTSVRTVQRWEGAERLPVHRSERNKSGRVFALRAELDRWRDGAGRGSRRLLRQAITVAIAVFFGAIAVWLTTWSHLGNSAPDLSYLTTASGWKVGPSFSPDGKQVVFAWDGGQNSRTRAWQIYRAAIGAGEPVQLTTKGGIWPAWSPDGRWIAFARPLDDIRQDIIVIPATGGEERRVAGISVRYDGRHRTVAWSPDGQWLTAPDRLEPDGPENLVLISLTTGARRKLTTPPAGTRGDRSPAWSPDGAAIAFARGLDIMVNEIFVLSVGSDYSPRGEPRQLTFDKRRSMVPVWGPDRKSVIYVSDGRFSRALWKVGVSGAAKPELLPFPEPGVTEATVSIRGRRLLFVRDRSRAGIWRLPLASRSRAGGEPVPFVPSAVASRAPAFSPDGQAVAFVSDRTGHDEVWRAEADSSEAVALTSMGHAFGPQWSPDGQWIAFESAATGNAHVYVMPAAGGRARQVTTGPFHNCTPSWSRDGEWIYFSSDRENGFQIWKAPFHGGAPLRVTRNGGHSVKEAQNGQLFYANDHTGNASLWMKAADGAERQIAPSVWLFAFEPGNGGVYMISPEAGNRRYALRFLDMESGEFTVMKKLAEPPLQGVSLAPHGGALLYSTMLEAHTDLMLVDGFR